MRPGRTVGGEERGSASFLLAALGTGLALVIWVGVSLAGWWASVHIADEAADTAALAAAAAQADGRAPCPVAVATARANGATLVGCRLEATSVDFVVHVSVRVPLTPQWRAPGLPTTATRSASAGPVR